MSPVKPQKFNFIWHNFTTKEGEGVVARLDSQNLRCGIRGNLPSLLKIINSNKILVKKISFILIEEKTNLYRH